MCELTIKNIVSCTKCDVSPEQIPLYYEESDRRNGPKEASHNRFSSIGFPIELSRVKWPSDKPN